jgi:hypothetical protein
MSPAAFFEETMKKTFLCAAISLGVTAPAHAATKIRATPVSMDGQKIRYEKGLPTIEDDLITAGVIVMPLPELDHVLMQFKDAVYNKAKDSSNVGIENVIVAHNNENLAVFSVNDLEKRANNRAFWSEVGYADLAGVADDETLLCSWRLQPRDPNLVQRSGV